MHFPNLSRLYYLGESFVCCAHYRGGALLLFSCLGRGRCVGFGYLPTIAPVISSIVSFLGSWWGGFSWVDNTFNEFCQACSVRSSVAPNFH